MLAEAVASGTSPVDVATRRARPALVEAITGLVAAHARGRDVLGAQESFNRVLGSTLLYGNLLGRYHTLKAADAVKRRFAVAMARDVAPLIEVPFAEAIHDLVSREPRLARDHQRLSAYYQSEHVFGLTRAADATVTERVQALLAEAMKRAGPGVDATVVAIQSAGDFARSYAETVLETNFATTYTEGRFDQAMDPAVRAVIPALRFTAVGDTRTRPNHRKADGLVASPDDPVWRLMKPPIGFRCRCRADFMSVEDCLHLGILDRAGNVRPARIPPGAFPDPGFRSAA